MGGLAIHDFVIWYVSVAAVVSVGAALLPDILRSADPPRGPSRALLAIAAGAVWPLLAVGALQWLLLRTLADRLPDRHAGLEAVAPVARMEARG